MLPFQVVFLTGQSDPRSCDLSPAQCAFLDALPVPDEAKAPLNFPYDAAMRPWRKVPLWLASVRHGRLFLAMRRPAFSEHRDAVIAQLDRADRTLVLAGSIGLDLLGRLDLPPELLDRLSVFAYGPVATRPPACETLRVCSRQDWVARCFRSGRRADVYVDSGHLDYLENPEVARLCRDLLTEVSTR
ncbi:hypothetical protein [Nocardioides speluncae]|uniref:hypothetical protein n=1 Tax=Nocardioides speluncae TaxID=2670337 RepID=UPI000D688B2D|nr:hypothetical protein [Nocardioides speluncae]